MTTSVSTCWLHLTEIHYHKIHPPDGVSVLDKLVHKSSSSACAIILWKLLLVAPPVELSKGPSGSTLFLFTLLLWCSFLFLTSGLSSCSCFGFGSGSGSRSRSRSRSRSGFGRGLFLWTVYESLELHVAGIQEEFN